MNKTKYLKRKKQLKIRKVYLLNSIDTLLPIYPNLRLRPNTCLETNFYLTKHYYSISFKIPDYSFFNSLLFISKYLQSKFTPSLYSLLGTISFSKIIEGLPVFRDLLKIRPFIDISTFETVSPFEITIYALSLLSKPLLNCIYL